MCIEFVTGGEGNGRWAGEGVRAHFWAILAEELCPEAVELGAGGALMVAPQQGHLLWRSQLQRGQHDQCLQAPSTSVHKVTCAAHSLSCCTQALLQTHRVDGVFHFQPPPLASFAPLPLERVLGHTRRLRAPLKMMCWEDDGYPTISSLHTTDACEESP